MQKVLGRVARNSDTTQVLEGTEALLQ